MRKWRLKRYPLLSKNNSLTQTKFIFTMTKLEITAKLMASEIATLAPEKLQEYISDNLKEFAADAVNSLVLQTEKHTEK